MFYDASSKVTTQQPLNVHTVFIIVQMRVFCLFSLVAALLSVAHAEILVRESSEDLMTQRRLNGLKALDKTDLSVSSGPTVDHQTTILITVGASYVNILAVALPDSKARDLAEAVAYGLEGEVAERLTLEYHSEDGKAVVYGEGSRAAFGSHSGSRHLQIGKLADALRLRAWDAAIVLRVAPYTQSQSTGLTRSQGTNWTFYGGRQVPTKVVDLKVEITALVMGAFYFFLIGPWLIGISCMVAAYVYGRNERIPIERRRKVYPKLALTPIFGSIAVHVPFALWFLVARGYRPFADLWFGTYSAMSISPFIIVPIPLMFLLLPAMTKLEKKLFGDSQLGVKPPELTPEENAAERAMKKITYVPLLLSAPFFLLYLLLPSNSPARFIAFAIVILLIVFGSSLIKLFFKNRMPLLVTERQDAEIESTARKLAQQMGTTFKDVIIDVSPNGRTIPHAQVTLKGQVRISQRLTELLNGPEIESIMAHELAHLKLGHLKFRQRMLFGLILVIVLPMSLYMVIRSVAGQSPIGVFVMGFPLALFPIQFFVLRPMMQRQEYAADEEVLRQTRNLDAAISAMVKLVENSPLPHAHEIDAVGVHPAMSKRLSRLREIGSSLGLEESPMGQVSS